MKRIKRKPTGQETQLRKAYQENLRLRGYVNEFMKFVKENNLVDHFDAWAILKGGGDNGLQGNREERRQYANEGKDGGCSCGKSSCCKEGEEEVKKDK